MLVDKLAFEERNKAHGRILKGLFIQRALSKQIMRQAVVGWT